MAQDIALDYNQLVTNQVQEIQTSLRNVGNRRIRVAGKKFRLPDGEEHAGPMHVVVLDWIFQNRLFEKTYDPSGDNTPECFAQGRPTGEHRGSPHEDLVPIHPKPVNPNCADCPKNQWGSKGKGKACSNRIIIAVAPAKATDAKHIMLLDLSPSSIKNFNRFVSKDIPAFARDNIDEPQTYHYATIPYIAGVSFDPNVSYASFDFEVASAHDNMENIAKLLPEAREILEEPPAWLDDAK